MIHTDGKPTVCSRVPLLKIRRELEAAEAEMRLMREHPYAVPCGEADALADRIDALRVEYEAAR